MYHQLVQDVKHHRMKRKTIHHIGCICKAWSILDNLQQLGYLPSCRRYQSIWGGTARFCNSFFPEADSLTHCCPSTTWLFGTSGQFVHPHAGLLRYHGAWSEIGFLCAIPFRVVVYGVMWHHVLWKKRFLCFFSSHNQLLYSIVSIKHRFGGSGASGGFRQVIEFLAEVQFTHISYDRVTY